LLSQRAKICAGEYAMADEAFALSPISARATQPSEEDYEAISQAFMETSRGRWFLGEYARRNRNADTSMVLDAVARIEENLAAQRAPGPDSGLAQALAAIGGAVGEARASADSAFDGLAPEERLAPIRKGARVIREIAWRLREIGADGRICDLIDSQVGAIEAGCAEISSAVPQADVHAAFDLIKARIAELAGDEAEPRQGANQAAAAADKASAGSDETRASAAEMVEAANTDVKATMRIPQLPSETATATARSTTATAEAADAHDEAVLDMIALEMAAPDASDSSDIPEPGDPEIRATKLAAAEPEIVVQHFAPTAARPPPPPPPLASEPSHRPSLGSTLIASGIVRRPNGSASDPLAPIRRMSQAEKIAFFS
jgi:hypothetical protein